MMEQRDLLLVPFPFSNQKGRKVRPVAVISNDEFNRHSEDVLVAGITLNISNASNLTNKDLEEGNLPAECDIKCKNILKIDKDMIIKKIGRIKKEKLGIIKNIILEIIK